MSDFPDFTFLEADEFYWSGKSRQIYVKKAELNSLGGLFQLFHELGHATLGHANFESAIQLLKMESDAWQQAAKIARSYDFEIDSEHIEHSLDTYRDWVHLRSVCPKCQAVGVETEANHYRCFNCRQNWQTPNDQRRRCYRKKLV